MSSRAKGVPRSVVVAGDPAWNEHLAGGASGRLEVHREPGGAWLLAEWLRLACRGLDLEISAPAQAGGAPSAYFLWSPQEEVAGGKKRVWRVREFLGCTTGTPAESEDGPPNPDLVVVDDLGFGCGDGGHWPAALKASGKPGAALLNTESASGGNRLLASLMESHRDRLTVVLPVAALRARRAAISKAVSWDRTIEETVREMHEGACARDLASIRRLIIHFGVAGAAVFTRPESGGPARFDRFLYRPDELEGTWEARRPGLLAGVGTIVTAAVARHLMDPDGYPLYIALGRALAAARASHERGAAGPDRIRAARDPEAAREILHPPAGAAEPASAYSVGFSHEGLEEALFKDQPGTESDLLRDLTGAGYDSVAARAFEVVHRGPDAALRSAPKARYGHFLTVDRQEIERINGIRNLILAYRDNPQDRRPLSLAVFGPPGSGKSFAIKQLASEMFGGRGMTLEFNLSQIDAVADLHTALHQVRDGSVRGQIPLVFWDEFDTGGLRWLKEFLAPMQDAEFRSGGLVYPLGKAVFVFAGGTSPEFEIFDKTSAPGEAGANFRLVKGPDFVSRLRGYVNIKGPNPAVPDPDAPGAAERDVAHLIRRAIMLRSGIQRFYPHLIDPATGAASAGAGVIRAFLRVRKYIHGARSLEALISMSDLSRAKHFGAAELPSPDLLRLHVTPDFADHVREGQLETAVLEALAEACHEAWREHRLAEGWRFGPVRDDGKKEHPLLRPYPELPENDKERSRPTARLTEAKLASIGCRIVAGGEPFQFTEAESRALMTLEHGIWMREHLLAGYAWASVTNDALRLHRDLVPFDRVPEEDKELDRLIIESIPPVLQKHGYAIVRNR